MSITAKWHLIPSNGVSRVHGCDRRTQRAGHASLPGPTALLVTELLQLPVPGYGTVYRHVSEMLTYRTVGSGGH